MADLFLSYAHQDTKRAQMVAKLLEEAGLTVWWDRRMVAGDKIHDVVDEQIEKAKAVIVLWSPFSVKSDWVRGEAQTAHELAKLVPIKIAECKVPINYRGIHTPAVYKSKSELDEFARMLSDKYRTAQASGVTLGPNGATEIKFNVNSSDDFLTQLAAQRLAYKKEYSEFSTDWSPEAWKRTFRLIKKYPLGAAGSGLSNLLKLIIIVLLAFLPLEFLDQMFDPVISAVFYSILAGLGFCIYTSFNRATNEKWVTAAERNIGYLLSLLLMNMIKHAGQAAYYVGVKSFTFATFAVLAL